MNNLLAVNDLTWTCKIQYCMDGHRHKLDQQSTDGTSVDVTGLPPVLDRIFMPLPSGERHYVFVFILAMSNKLTGMHSNNLFRAFIRNQPILIL